MALVDVWVIAMPALTYTPNLQCMCCAPFNSILFSSVLFFSCLLFARMANGFRSRVASIKRVWLKNSYYYYPHSHTHRIQMRNENLMILFALLFASFRNLFILHSFVRSSARSFIRLFIWFSFIPFHSSPPFRASLCSLYSMNKPMIIISQKDKEKREKCFQAIQQKPIIIRADCN